MTARSFQGAFAAILVPSALSLLTTTFAEGKDRGKAFGVYSAVAAAGGAVGLLLGGALTEYLDWRFTLYINLVFASVAFTGGALLLKERPSPIRPRLDIPGVLLVSSALFCVVYGFSNAATHHWSTPSTWGFLVGDAGEASATVTTGQQLGASIGTSLLNTIYASAVASYLTAHAASQELAQVYGYDTAYWWTAGIFAGGAVVGGILLRRGPLVPKVPSAPRATTVRGPEVEAGPAAMPTKQPAGHRAREPRRPAPRLEDRDALR
jgi:MFS family permease